MALGFYITGKGFTQEKYDTTLGQLEDAGAGAPDGRIFHVALETDGEIQVFDIWESREAFEAFGATLIPILNAAGIELNEPMVARVHNEIKVNRARRPRPAVRHLRPAPRANGALATHGSERRGTGAATGLDDGEQRGAAR